MVQTCVVACSSLAFSGGFGCYLLSMDAQTFRNLGTLAGNHPQVGCVSFHPVAVGELKLTHHMPDPCQPPSSNLPVLSCGKCNTLLE